MNLLMNLGPAFHHYWWENVDHFYVTKNDNFSSSFDGILADVETFDMKFNIKFDYKDLNTALRYIVNVISY